MKLLKYLFLLIILLLIGSAAYVALMNGKYEFEENIEAASPRSLLFNQVDNLKNWENWFQQKDGKTEIIYSDNPKGEGAHVRWINKSKNLKAELATREVITNSRIRQEASSEGRLAKTHYTLIWDFEQEADSSQINVHIKARQNFWSKAFNLIGKEKDLEKELKEKSAANLQKLKNKVLDDMKVYAVNVDGVKTIEAQNYLYISQATKNSPDLIAGVQEKLLLQLQENIENRNITHEGLPMIIFNSRDFNNDNAIISVALPVSDSLDFDDPQNKILKGNLPDHKAVKATLKGNYKNISELWEAVENYISENQLEKDEEINPFEILKTTSAQTENPAEQLTELYIPIKEVELRTPPPIERDSI